MNGRLLHVLVPLCGRVADLLVNSAWKGLVLVAGVALLLRAMPRLSAAARSVLWTGVLVLVVALPAFSPGAQGSGEGARTLLQAGVVWSVALCALWGGLSVLRLLQLAASGQRLWSIARRAVRVEAPHAVRALLRRDRRGVVLCVSSDVGRPSVAGFLRPCILLPPGLLEELSEAELEHVVLHELEHLRRRDDWTNLLQKLSLALFPLHPALLWLDRRICRERELACDDGVLRVTSARKAYAACLARLAEDSMARRGISLALGLLGVMPRGTAMRSELGGRVQRILRSPAASMGRAQARLVTAALLFGVLGGSMLLQHSPQLIRFAPGGTPAESAAGAVSFAAPSTPVAMAPFRATPVRAVLEQRKLVPGPRAVQATLAGKRRRSAPRQRVAQAAQEPRFPGPTSYDVVLTAWQATTHSPRLTFAVASADQDSQPTYAAVPVRGGWLFIQL